MLWCSLQMKALTNMDDASHGCQQKDKSKLFPACNQEASMSQTNAHALVYGCSHAWMFPRTFKTEEHTGIRHSQREYLPKGTTTSARAEFKTLGNFFASCFYTMSSQKKKKKLLEKWKPLSDKKSQTTSQIDFTCSIKRQQKRAKLRRAYCLVYKNSGVEITSSLTDVTSWYTSQYY